VQIKRLCVTNFRCFPRFETDLDTRLILIEGGNGSGKTSLLEAIHYGCYLRSFRSSVPRDLVRFGQDGFFVRMETERMGDAVATQHDLQVGFADGKRLVKADKQRIATYKELINHIRVVCLTEDDLELVKGGPQARRLFLDQALLLQDPDYAQVLRAFRQIVNNRNALLRHGSWCADTYAILTEQMWRASRDIEERRIQLLSALTDNITERIATHFEGAIPIALRYKASGGTHKTFEIFMADFGRIEQQERRFYRSAFGAHLDDFGIEFCKKRARGFASRGQQKLTVLLLKLAQIDQTRAVTGVRPAFLVDDFLTDFDERTACTLLQLLRDIELQSIFTSPLEGRFLSNTLLGMGAQRISMSN